MDFKQLVNWHFTNQILNNPKRSPSKQIFLGFFGLQLIDVFVGNLNSLGSVIKNAINLYIQHHFKSIELQKLVKTPYTAHIEFHRDYSNTDETQTYVDAIIHHISQLNSVIKLQRRKIYLVNSKDEFEITKDIKGRVKNIGIKDNAIFEIVFEIYSYTLTLGKLREWVDGLYEIYKMDLQMGFGKHKYYFNHKVGGTMTNAMESQHLIFDMNKFETNKSLSNLFGEQIKSVNKRIQMFQNDKEWYETKGIPYTFGLLLHGIPGCGKTSLIKAISKDTQRHILNIKLSPNITLTQLRNLFYSDKIKVFTDVNTPPRYITIPMDQRIYVMEDVDCLTTILNQRNTYTEEEKLSDEDIRNIKMLGKERWQQMKNLNTDKIVLSDILNIIDGVLETPGRILILTSNFPEKLDTALLRPGRIDLIVNFKECNATQLQDMFEHFYNTKFTFDYSLIENVHTPAYVQEIFLRYMRDPYKAFSFLYEQRGEQYKTDIQNTNEQDIMYKSMIIDQEIEESVQKKLLQDVMNNEELLKHGGIETEENSLFFSPINNDSYLTTSKSWGIPKPSNLSRSVNRY
jgi:hypothetical protein